MKKWDVVFYKKAFFLVSKTSKEHAFINLIRTDGVVDERSQKISKKSKVSLIKNAKKKIKIEIPFKTVNNFKYNSMVEDAKKCVYEILVNKDEKSLNYLLHLATMSCKTPVDGKFNTLENFAANIKLKKPQKLYQMIARRMMENYDSRENSLVMDMADKTLSKIISDYMTFWDCFHGFDKELDEALEKDFAMHMAEFRRRETEAESV